MITAPTKEAPALLGCAVIRVCVTTLINPSTGHRNRDVKVGKDLWSCLVLPQAARLKHRDKQGYPRAKLVLLQISLS